MFPTFWCLASVLFHGLAYAQNNSLEIYPKKTAVKPNGSVTINCTSTRPIAECKFRLRHQYTDRNTTEDGPILIITSQSNYTQTRVNVTDTGQTLYEVDYDGKTIMMNECRINLTKLVDGRYLVGCQVRDQNGSWDERYMALYVDDKKKVFKSNNLDDHIIQVMKFNITGILNLNLTHYNLFTKVCELEKNQNVTLQISQMPRLTAYNKTCTFSIEAEDAARGPLWATAQYKNDKKMVKDDTWHFIKIIVIEKPKIISLALNLSLAEDRTQFMEEISSSEDVTHSYMEGDVMGATCSVHESRYGAEISWKFGNKTLNPCADGWDVYTTNNTDTWTWPWETKTIDQTVSKSLSSTDNGKILQCIANFFHYEKDIVESKEITLLMKEIPRQETKEDSQHLATLLVPLFGVLAIVIVASVIYAIRAKKKCFKPPASDTEEIPVSQWPQKAQNGAVATNTSVPEHTTKPWAKTPEQPQSQASIDPRVRKHTDFKAEEKVVYAEIVGVSAGTSGRTKITMTEETTYAELSWE